MDPTPLKASEIDQELFTVEQLRTRLRPFDSIDLINEVQNTLKAEWRSLSKNQIEALSLQVNIQFRKLTKVLPELKATDHTISGGNSKVTFVINTEALKNLDSPAEPASVGEDNGREVDTESN